MAKIPVVFPSTPEEQQIMQELYDAGLAAWGGDSYVHDIDDPAEGTVLEVRAEGGTLAILRKRNLHGNWEYRCLRDETTILDVLPEGDIGKSEVMFEQSAHVTTFDDALRRLDKYPWFRLFPMKVSVDFTDLVLREVERRGGREAAAQWAERLKNYQSHP